MRVLPAAVAAATRDGDGDRCCLLELREGDTERWPTLGDGDGDRERDCGSGDLDPRAGAAGAAAALDAVAVRVLPGVLVADAAAASRSRSNISGLDARVAWPLAL